MQQSLLRCKAMHINNTTFSRLIQSSRTWDLTVPKDRRFQTLTIPSTLYSGIFGVKPSRPLTSGLANKFRAASSLRELPCAYRRRRRTRPHYSAYTRPWSRHHITTIYGNIRTDKTVYTYIFYSPHYSGRQNIQTRNRTKQTNEQTEEHMSAEES